jgi:hypothetical protein
MTEDLFLEGDPFDDPAWQWVFMIEGAPPRPAKNYYSLSASFLLRVLPILRVSDRLMVAMVLYRKCLMQSSRTVDLSNDELSDFGIGRKTKYRALAQLQEAGAITTGTNTNGRSIRVTLHWFP